MHAKHAILFKVLSDTLHVNGPQPPLPHPSPIHQYLAIPVDVFQLVLPQKDVSQMKDTYVFLQKAGPSHL